MSSFDPLDWAFHHAPMLLTEKGKPDSTARFVLAKVAWHAHANGTGTFPSITEIRYATGLDDRTVERSLRRLERGGLIQRDGVSSGGTVRWKLALTVVRPASDRALLSAEVEETKRRETAKRKARRMRATGLVSGTENAGHPDVSGTESAGQNQDEIGHVRDFKSRQVPPEDPMSGTENPGVRHFKSRRPARNAPRNPQEPSGTTGGHAAPQTPLRQPTPTGPVNESGTSPPEVVTDQTDLATQPTTRAPAENPRRCEHGLVARLTADGSPACQLCRRALPAEEPS